MSLSGLTLRSVTYHWRTNLAVVLGVAAAVSVLGGALLVGDSVRGSLRDLVLSRLGRTNDVVASMGLAAAFGALNLNMLREVCEGTLRTTAMVMLIVFAALFLNFALAAVGMTAQLIDFIDNLGMSPIQTLWVVILFYIVIGCFMETLSMLITTTPLIAPIRGFQFCSINPAIVVPSLIRPATSGFDVNLPQAATALSRNCFARLTASSPVRLMASAGQTSAQVGCSQCLQTTGTVCTDSARSTYSRWIMDSPR